MLTRAPGLLKRYPLLSFFVLSYVITWPGWWLEAVGSEIRFEARGNDGIMCVVWDMTLVLWGGHGN